MWLAERGRTTLALLTTALVFGVACGDEEAGGNAGGSAGSAGKSASGGSTSGGAAGSTSGGAGGSTSGGNGGSTSGGNGGSNDGSLGAGGTNGSGSGGTSSGGTGAAGGAGGADAAPEVCDSTCRFVRAGAAANGNGTSWTDAFAALPATLERGNTYYVADGDYPKYRFDDPASGADLITIRKATAARHGSDSGWQPDYGEGTARFGPLEFSAPYYVFDGQAGAEVVGEFQGNVVDVGADHVTIRQTDINGAFGTNGSGDHDRGACTGLSINGSFVRIEGSRIHDVADDGVSISGSTEIDFVSNTVHALHACGTDGGCGPCYNGHSDGIETYDVERSRFVGNFVYDVRSTATLFMGNWADSLGNGPSEYCEDILLANNIFYAPEVGLVAYIQDVRGIRVFHNVFWGVRQGGYGGLSIGQHVTDLELYNNVILSINLAHVQATFNAAEHRGDYNLFGADIGQWTNRANDIVAGDPGFLGIPGMTGAPVAAPTPQDFGLEPQSPAVNQGFAGDAQVVLPTTDFFGAARGSQPDIGAIESSP